MNTFFDRFLASHKPSKNGSTFAYHQRYAGDPMSFLRVSRFFLPISGILVLLSFILLIFPGPKLSIDFTGGTLIELRIPEVTKDTLLVSLRTFERFSPLDVFTIAQTKEGTFLLRMRDLSNEEHAALLTHINATLPSPATELQFTTIGPTVGKTLQKRAILALSLAGLAIVLYIAFAFRKVPRHLSPWKFGLSAVIALIHDVAIVCGVFVVLSHITTFEVDTLFITALLTIIGYSVNDTIVIFDRIRENLFLQHRSEDFAVVAERGLQESLPRSIHTSFSTITVLLFLFFLGSESIRWFVLALITGMIVGTYSSIFLATPILVHWRARQRH